MDRQPDIREISDFLVTFDRLSDFRRLAQAQRQLVLVFAVGLMTLIGVILTAIVGVGQAWAPNLETVYFGLLVMLAIAIFRVQWRLGENLFFSFLWGFAAFVPLLNLLAVLASNRAASIVLRDAGITPRFLGVPDASVIHALCPWLCCCGYNLTGNTSGRCPECGRPLSEEARSAIVRRAADLARDAGAA